MPTSKSAKARMEKAVREAIAAGNGVLANEITANVMVGTTMMIIFVVMLVCLLLNEAGVFTADSRVMRQAVILAAVIEVPITVLNSKYVGTKPWLKVPLMVDLILVCAILAATLGHNVTLVMVFPIVVSLRYFDERYTRKVALWTAAAFAVSSFLNGFFGILNLNVLQYADGAELTVLPGEKLRTAVMASGFDMPGYVKSLFLNDFLPRCIIFLCLSVSCRFVASRGKSMIAVQEENARKTSRIETELDLATKIQTSMLPCLCPAFPEHRNIVLRAVYHPAKEVGGDFYDYFNIDETHVGMVVADVSGKGVGAALFMTISKTVLKNQIQLGIPLEEAMRNANRQLCENNDAELFVTCWAGVFDTEAGVLTFVNAGHNPPVLVRRGGKAEFLKQRSGFVLAGLEGYPYKQETLELTVGDEIVFYTDGVTEAADTKNELFGNDRLLETVEKFRYETVGHQLDKIKEDIDAFVGGADQFDDITIMVMKIT